MLLLVIRKEIVHNILSFRFVATYALLMSLIFVALFLMTSDYAARRQVATTELALERDRLARIADIEDASQQFNEFRGAALVGVREPQSLSILARGLDDDLPSRVSTGGWGNQSSASERLSKNLLFEIFQAPDFVYVINIVMSLLALLFVFDSICGEKEQGTLKLMLANSIPRDVILSAKWIGGYLSVIAPFTVAALAGLVYVNSTGIMPAGGDGVDRYLLIYGLSLATSRYSSRSG